MVQYQMDVGLVLAYIGAELLGVAYAAIRNHVVGHFIINSPYEMSTKHDNFWCNIEI